MFTQQYRKEQQAAAARVSPQELTALAASQWRVMTAADREPFVKASLAERAQYDGQYRAWKEANPDVPTGYSKDKRARAEVPSRSAYTLFLDSLREHEGHHMPEKALVQRAAALWQSFSPGDRIPFQNEAKRERAVLKAARPKSEKKKAKTATAAIVPATLPELPEVVTAPEVVKALPESIRQLEVPPEFSFLLGDASDEGVRGGSFDCAEFAAVGSADFFLI